MKEYRLGQKVSVLIKDKWKSAIICAIIKEGIEINYLLSSTVYFNSPQNRFEKFYIYFKPRIEKGDISLLQDCDAWKGDSLGWHTHRRMKTVLENIE